MRVRIQGLRTPDGLRVLLTAAAHVPEADDVALLASVAGSQAGDRQAMPIAIGNNRLCSRICE